MRPAMRSRIRKMLEVNELPIWFPDTLEDGCPAEVTLFGKAAGRASTMTVADQRMSIPREQSQYPNSHNKPHAETQRR